MRASAIVLLMCLARATAPPSDALPGQHHPLTAYLTSGVRVIAGPGTAPTVRRKEPRQSHPPLEGEGFPALRP